MGRAESIGMVKFDASVIVECFNSNELASSLGIPGKRVSHEVYYCRAYSLTLMIGRYT